VLTKWDVKAAIIQAAKTVLEKSHVVKRKGKVYREREHSRKGREKAALSIGESTKLFWSSRKRTGFTYSPIMHGSPKTGYVVSIWKQYEKPLKLSQITAQTFRKFLDAHVSIFEQNPGAHLGGWYDKQTRRYVLDISKVEKNRQKAMQLGKKHKQDAIWDLLKGQEIRLAAQAARYVRFDFPSNATPEEIAAALRKLAE
jgi:hypothetical protein